MGAGVGIGWRRRRPVGRGSERGHRYRTGEPRPPSPGKVADLNPVQRSAGGRRGLGVRVGGTIHNCRVHSRGDRAWRGGAWGRPEHTSWDRPHRPALRRRAWIDQGVGGGRPAVKGLQAAALGPTNGNTYTHTGAHAHAHAHPHTRTRTRAGAPLSCGPCATVAMVPSGLRPWWCAPASATDTGRHATRLHTDGGPGVAATVAAAEGLRAPRTPDRRGCGHAHPQGRRVPGQGNLHARSAVRVAPTPRMLADTAWESPHARRHRPVQWCTGCQTLSRPTHTTHARARTHAHTHTHTCRTCTQTQMSHVHTHTHTRACTSARAHARAHTRAPGVSTGCSQSGLWVRDW